jgi:hypothetical protein
MLNSLVPCDVQGCRVYVLQFLQDSRPGRTLLCKIQEKPSLCSSIQWSKYKQASKERKVCIDPFIGATKQGSKDRKTCIDGQQEELHKRL